MQPLAQDQAITLAKTALPMADLQSIKESVRHVNEEYEKSIEEETAELHSDLSKMHKDTMTIIRESMASSHLAANKVIHDVYTKYGINTGEALPDTVEFEQEDLARISRAELLIRNLEAVNSQTGLIAFVADANINDLVAYNPVFVERQLEKLQHFFRTHKIKNFEIDNALKIAKKYDNYAEIRDKTAVLYCFLRYLNHLKASKQLIPNIIYMNYTAAAICGSFSGETRLAVTDALKPLIKKHVISK